MSQIRLLFFLLLLNIAVGSIPSVKAACNDITTFADGLTPSRVLHVDPNGNDTTGNGSIEFPYETIQYAAGLATPGTAIVIHPGTYYESVILNNLAGTSEAPIWIGGASGEGRPIITGGNEAIHLFSAKYVVLHDLEIRNTAYNGINADDSSNDANPTASHHLLFKNLFIHDIGGTGNQDGLKLSGIRDFIVVNCQIMRCGGGVSGSGIDMVGCHRGLIIKNEFQNMSGNAIQVKGGSSDVEIRWNRIWQGGARAINIGGSTGFDYFRPPLSTTEPNFEASNIRVLSNIIEYSSCAFAFVGSVNSVAANNTIVNPTTWIFRILQETVTSPSYTFLPSGNNNLENNLFYFDRSDISTFVNIGPNTDSASFSFRHNLWYAHNNPNQSTPSLPIQEIGGIYGQDPLFRDFESSDFHIDPESHAALAGSLPPQVTGDFDGRCYEEPPSIGAFEIPLKGDINGDGNTDLQDCLLGLLVMVDAEIEGPRSDYANSHTDVNGDNIIGMAEIIYVLQRLSELP